MAPKNAVMSSPEDKLQCCYDNPITVMGDVVMDLPVGIMVLVGHRTGIHPTWPTSYYRIPRKWYLILFNVLRCVDGNIELGVRHHIDLRVVVF
ncbi:Polynucleotide kinase [Dirofilaria immitis]